MGCNFLARNSQIRYMNNTPHPNDPDPSLFIIMHVEQIGSCVLAIIKYPNCTNFEGEKVIVWKDRTVSEIQEMVSIDPHFNETDKTLVARFIPTGVG